MSKNKKSPEDVERFITFLSDDDSLESSQDNIKEFNSKLSVLLKDANSTLNTLKLKKAADERKVFLDKQKSRVSSLMEKFKTRAEMAKALIDGSFGINGQKAAQVFFRDRDVDEISEEELKSILEDQELLNLLGKDD